MFEGEMDYDLDKVKNVSATLMPRKRALYLFMGIGYLEVWFACGLFSLLKKLLIL